MWAINSFNEMSARCFYSYFKFTANTSQDSMSFDMPEFFRGRYIWKVSPIFFHKGHSCCNLLIAFLHVWKRIFSFPWKRATLKGKKLLPAEANSFLLERPLFRREVNNHNRLAVHENECISLTIRKNLRCKVFTNRLKWRLLFYGL